MFIYLNVYFNLYTLLIIGRENILGPTCDYLSFRKKNPIF
jgi:hypothetical protein